MSEQKSLKSWLAGLSAALFFFFEFMLMQMGGTLRGDWVQAFHIDISQFSLLASMFLYGNTALLIPAGILLDRYSVRRVMLTVIPIAALATLGFAYTHHFALAAAFRFVQGAGNAFCFLACVLVTSQWFPSKWRGFVMGLIVTIAMLGGMVAQTPLALYVMAVGWRKAMTMIAILGFLTFLMFMSFVQDKRTSAEMSQANLDEELNLLVRAIKNKDNWRYGLYISLLNLPVMVIVALWGNAYLQSSYHLNLAEASFINSFILFGTIVGSPILGSLSDRFQHRQTVMAYGAILSLIALTIILFVPIHSMVLLTALFFILGFASSAQVIGYPVITECNPVELQAKATAVASVVIMGGAALAENLTGWLLAVHRPIQLHDFQHTFSLMLLGFIVSFLICWRDLRMVHMNSGVNQC